MNSLETGKLIAKLRKEAGYTQKALAHELGITDKAVSKWERGVGLPDASLLPSIAKLLDCDIEILISGLSEYQNHKWEGLLILDQYKISLSIKIYDKPLINYLLSYYMLVGINKIYIKATIEQQKYIKKLKLEKYGLEISFTNPNQGKLLIIDKPIFVFGVNLTRTFQSYMSQEVDIIPTIDNFELPISFSHNQYNKELLDLKAERRKMGRGMIKISLDSKDDIKDASEFVKIYQKHHNQKIADLEEIAINRGLV